MSAVILSVVAAGLCAAMMTTVTSRAAISRHSRDGMVAMELVSNGLSLARAEYLADKDLDGNGKGATQATIGGGDFKVDPTKLDNTHYRLIGTADFGSERRTVESVVEVSQAKSNPFQYAAFGLDWVVFNGGSKGDAYDSALGTYAGQAVNLDKWGNTIAVADCDVGSNGPITVSGSGTVVNGDVTPGPDDSTTINGGGKVDGSTSPMPADQEMPPIDTSAVYDANGQVIAALKNYASWTKVGNASVDASGNVVVQNGGTITIPAGTYYANSIKLTNNSKLVTQGKVVLYVGHKVDASGGSFVNTSQIPANFQIYGLGDESQNGSDNVSISTKDGFFGTIYAPKMGVTISGGGSYFGAVVGLTVKDTGGSAFHFDLALKNLSAPVLGKIVVKQISWKRVPNSLASN